MKTFPVFFAVAIFVSSFFVPSFASTCFGQGKLGGIRSNVRKHSPSTSQPQSHRKEKDDDDRRPERRSHKRQERRRPPRNCGNDFFGISFFTPPTVVNQVVVEETYVVPPVMPVVPPVPQSNFAIIDRPVPEMPEPTPVISQPPYVHPPVREPIPVDVPQVVLEEVRLEDWASRLTVFGGSDFDGLGQGGLGLLLQDPGGIGLDASATMFRESGTSFRDHLWIGDVNLVYEPVLGDVRARVGAGLNWLGDQYGGEAGLNLTGGFDWRVATKTILTGEVDFGTLGDSDFLNAQLTLGQQFGDAEAFVGYRYMDVGGADLSNVMFGVRFRK